MEVRLGARLLGKKGWVDLKTFTSHEFTLGYFSASWCPPCRQFTPILRDFYGKVNTPSKRLEIVLISRDQDKASFQKYYDEMPWLALDYDDRDRLTKLMTLYGVKTIPTLILFNKNGDAVASGCRNQVVQSGVSILPTWQQLLTPPK